MLVSPRFNRLLNVQRAAAWLCISVATILVVALAASLAQAQAQPTRAANDRSASATEGLANSSARPKRVALVVGNSDYAVRHLPNAKNDADDIGAILKTFGFEVEVIKNVEKKALGRAVAAFGEKAYGAEAALFFFAGHGSQEKGRNYLWPLGANPKDIGDAEDELFNLNRVLDEIEGKARTSIVILDACRDAPLTGKARSGVGGFKEVQPPDGTVVVFATAANKTADDGRERNGVFTGALLKAMRGNDLSLGGVLSSTAIEVARVKPGQRPYAYADEFTRANFFFKGTVKPMLVEKSEIIPRNVIASMGPLKLWNDGILHLFGGPMTSTIQVKACIEGKYFDQNNCLGSERQFLPSEIDAQVQLANRRQDGGVSNWRVPRGGELDEYMQGVEEFSNANQKTREESGVLGRVFSRKVHSWDTWVFDRQGGPIQIINQSLRPLRLVRDME